MPRSVVNTGERREARHVSMESADGDREDATSISERLTKYKKPVPGRVVRASIPETLRSGLVAFDEFDTWAQYFGPASGFDVWEEKPKQHWRTRAPSEHPDTQSAHDR